MIMTCFLKAFLYVATLVTKTSSFILNDCDDDQSVDCWTFDHSHCIGIYEAWARKHCPLRCDYCLGPGHVHHTFSHPSLISPNVTTPTAASTTSTVSMYLDCWEIKQAGQNRTGIYTIYPWQTPSLPVDVLCNMDIDPGGWTVFQRRFNGSISFDRNWTEYKYGFGNPDSEYWLGNEALHQITSRSRNKLHITLTHVDGTEFYEDYHSFAINGESDYYRLFLDGPVNGTAGDFMMDTGLPQADLGGKVFSTPDHHPINNNCANRLHAGWWYSYCHFAMLNGEYNKTSWFNPWHHIINQGDLFAGSQMAITRQ